MNINNEIYETYGDGWWAEDAVFDHSSLRYCVNPVRYGFFKRKLHQLHPPGRRVLDVGCGGGFLSEEFARDGFAVTGLDPAQRSVEAARRHAVENGLMIDYLRGKGEILPFPDASFDIVACCDVLEHVEVPGKVIDEVSRVLKPSGVFFYDTVNRTAWSRLIAVKIAQDWSLTRCLQPHVHVWEMFIKPSELIALMGERNLINGEMKGISLRLGNIPGLLWNLRAIRSGRIRNEAMAAKFDLYESDNLNLSYMGYAVKRPSCRV